MSQAITHLAFGGGATALALTLLPARPGRPRLWIASGAMWGLLPDVGKLTPLPRMPPLHDSHWADLFWLHRTLDRVDPADSMALGIMLTVGVLGVIVVLERRDYRSPLARTGLE